MQKIALILLVVRNTLDNSTQREYRTQVVLWHCITTVLNRGRRNAQLDIRQAERRTKIMHHRACKQSMPPTSNSTRDSARAEQSVPHFYVRRRYNEEAFAHHTSLRTLPLIQSYTLYTRNSHKQHKKKKEKKKNGYERQKTRTTLRRRDKKRRSGIHQRAVRAFCAVGKRSPMQQAQGPRASVPALAPNLQFASPADSPRTKTKSPLLLEPESQHCQGHHGRQCPTLKYKIPSRSNAARKYKHAAPSNSLFGRYLKHKRVEPWRNNRNQPDKRTLRTHTTSSLRG